MSKSLLVVESPTKVRTIRRYLGDRYTVMATMGHIKDLPASKLGVDVRNRFEPQYTVIRGKEKVLAAIVKAARGVDAIFLAPDPDREGEAIAYHVAEALGAVGVPVTRVLFHEITKQGIQEGLDAPRPIDVPKFESQQARRILDRLVGYELSPVLWKKVQRGLSAGRVQSVALRLIVERELAIRAFVPQEYWLVFATLADAAGPAAGAFRAQLVRIDGAPPKITDEAAARTVRQELEQGRLRVAKLDDRTRQRRAPPPYITSRLQQDASARFRFSARRTMQAAQKLYEGVEIGAGGPTGLITYMRTDSTRVSAGAVASCREFIGATWGPEAVPAKPNFFAARAGAQDAHEAIRPADVSLTPEKVVGHLSPELAKVYGLIWRRFVASQMRPAVYALTSVDVEATPAAGPGRTLRLRSTCSRLVEKGWLAVMGDPTDGGDDGNPAAAPEASREKRAAEAPAAVAEDDESGCAATALPPLREGQLLTLVPPGVATDQKFTQPPARFTEGSLVREMEDLGIGRPSTYAAIVSTILERRYVRKADNRLQPTELGEIVNDRLTRHFPGIIEARFTARMEEELDAVEEGRVDWRKLLADFYEPFHRDVEKALREMVDVRAERTQTDEKCEKCGSPMIKRWGRAGWFLACTTYPRCNFTKDVPGSADAAARIALPDVTGEKCHLCGKDMKVRRGRFGAFLACTGYPACKGTRPLPTGVICPTPGCGGAVVERRTRNGRTFWECANRKRVRGRGAKADAAPPETAPVETPAEPVVEAPAGSTPAAAAPAEAPGCDFVSWRRPIPTPCPQCGAPYIVEVKARGGTSAACERTECGWRGPLPGSEPAPEAGT